MVKENSPPKSDSECPDPTLKDLALELVGSIEDQLKGQAKLGLDVSEALKATKKAKRVMRKALT